MVLKGAAPGGGPLAPGASSCTLLSMDLADDLLSLLTWSGSTRTSSAAATPTTGHAAPSSVGRWRPSACSPPRPPSSGGRLPHSFHGYFLRAGRSDIPVILEVDRDRDGRSFSARRVVAVQDGDVIFSMVTSFHVESEGARFDDAPRRSVPAPEDTTLGGWNTLLDVRPVTPTDFLKGVFTDCLWVKSAVSLGDDPLLHRAGLTYLSDLGTGFGQQDRKTRRPWRPVHRPLRVVPGGHPG